MNQAEIAGSWAAAGLFDGETQIIADPVSHLSINCVIDVSDFKPHVDG